MKTINEMKTALEMGHVTSVQLVDEASGAHRKFLSKNALAQISPIAKKIAKKRDEERRQGFIRGPLHGIPIVIKDNIFYKDGTPTTCNAYAFHDFYPPHHAPIVDYLIDKGAIILGKANLSEFAYFMGDEKTPSGYGSMYGQVKHPFDETIDPLGSSTGSAVAVKLGIVPAAIGTETNGSLMAPAFQCQIVSLKPTFGLVTQAGIIPLSPLQDTAGPMANCCYDCALLMDALTNDQPTEHPFPFSMSFTDAITKPLNQGKVGIVHFKDHPYSSEELQVIEQSKAKLTKAGFTYVEITVELPPLENERTLLVEFKYAINRFLQTYNDKIPYQNLDGIIEFHKNNAQRCLKYGQAILEKATASHGDLTNPEYLKWRDQLLTEAHLFEQLLHDHDLIAIGAPTWSSFAPIYGNPSLCIPEGIINKQPKAMVFVGKKFDDQTLLRFGHSYEGSHSF